MKFNIKANKQKIIKFSIVLFPHLLFLIIKKSYEERNSKSQTLSKLPINCLPTHWAIKYFIFALIYEKWNWEQKECKQKKTNKPVP